MSMDNGLRLLANNFDSDTTIVQKQYGGINGKYFKPFKNRDTIFPRYDLKIIIDTSYTVFLKGYEYENINVPSDDFIISDGLINGKIPTSAQIEESNQILKNYFEKLLEQTKNYVECYTLLIYNNSNKPACFNDIKLIQQAKDSDGQWKPIEYFWNVPTCIPNTFYYEFLPKKYDALSIIRYNGNFKAKLRVKIKINDEIYYSNEITGSINKSQFDKETARKRTKLWKPGWNDDFEPTLFLENTAK